jgi:GNAT superfamily N-acetyltransferase
VSLAASSDLGTDGSRTISNQVKPRSYIKGDAGMTSTNPELDTVLRFIRDTTALAADELRAVDGGWVVRSPSLPQAWGLNHVRVQHTIPFDKLLALADREFAHLPYQHVILEDAAAGGALEPAFASGGWKIDREVLMILRHEPNRTDDSAAVTELPLERLSALHRSWRLESQPNLAPEVMDQLDEYTRREAAAKGDRGFAICDAAGEPHAMTTLRSDGRVAQVEDVYTLPEARGRGYARALIAYVLARARTEDHELVFIMADDDDWPKQLYGRLGFEPAGCMLGFHREL